MRAKDASKVKEGKNRTVASFSVGRAFRLIKQSRQSAGRLEHFSVVVRDAWHVMKVVDEAGTEPDLHLREIPMAARVAVRSLGLAHAALVELGVVWVSVVGAEQVDYIARSVYDLVGVHGLIEIARYAGGEPILPVVVGRTREGPGKGSQPPVGTRPLRREVYVGRRVCDHVAHMNAPCSQDALSLTDHRVALDDLTARRMAGDHDLREAWKQCLVS